MACSGGAVTRFCPLNIFPLKLTSVQRAKGVKEEKVADSKFLFRQPLPSGAERASRVVKSKCSISTPSPTPRFPVWGVKLSLRGEAETWPAQDFGGLDLVGKAGLGEDGGSHRAWQLQRCVLNPGRRAGAEVGARQAF